MREDKNIIYISIGGVEYATKVLYKDVEGFLKGFNKIVRKHQVKAGKQFQIPNEYFFNTLWKCLVKDGSLFWKKPFRSKRHMINSILYDEISEITMFISKHVLKFEDDAVDKTKKKQK